VATRSNLVSAHTHQPYVCWIPNRVGRKIPVTSASAYGRMITDIDVTIDTRTRGITAVTARNIRIDRTNAEGITPDAALTNLVDKYAVLAAPIANRQVGSITGEITRARDASLWVT
jgi:5'-nucleotidase